MSYDVTTYPSLAAVAADVKAHGGGRLDFSAGRWVVGSAFSDLGVPIVIRGEGKATRLVDVAITGNTGSLELEDLSLEGVQANALRVATISSDQVTISTRGVGVIGSTHSGVVLQSCNSAILESLYCNECQGDGLRLDGAPAGQLSPAVGNVFLTNFQCSALPTPTDPYATSTAIRLNGCNGFYCTKGDIEGIGEDYHAGGTQAVGVAITPGAGQIVTGLHISGLTVAYVAGIGWAFASAGGEIEYADISGCAGIACVEDNLLLGGSFGLMSMLEFRGFVGNGSLNGSGVHWQNGTASTGIKFVGGTTNGNAWAGHYISGALGTFSAATLLGVSAWSNTGGGDINADRMTMVRGLETCDYGTYEEGRRADVTSH